MEMRKTRRKVSTLEQRLGSPVEFMLDSPPYDRSCRDQIACILKSDICDEIDTLRQQYSDPEIEGIYRELREFGRVRLSRPLFVTFEIGA